MGKYSRDNHEEQKYYQHKFNEEVKDSPYRSEYILISNFQNFYIFSLEKIILAYYFKIKNRLIILS